VPLLIEATNHDESAVANNPFVRILPDTFHMNIEERDQFESLAKYAALYDSLHISDNNRYFPGFGAVRFAGLFKFLLDNGYSGGLAIEGNVRQDLLSDIRGTMEYLTPLLQSPG
jgi:sugar phosphate isomerase/epimerase